MKIKSLHLDPLNNIKWMRMNSSPEPGPRPELIRLCVECASAKRSVGSNGRQSHGGAGAADIDSCLTLAGLFVVHSCDMSSNKISEKCQNDTKLNGISATFVDRGLVPLNGRYRSKSLSSDKLNGGNADRTAILEDVEAHDVSEKSETPGCLVQNRVVDKTLRRYVTHTLSARYDCPSSLLF
ncbi:hypothetical protein EVAR_44025_1 [Eumeta japonica]|uniref:Uncharacterized protein n=1 Tax=Eumeta variegata TaxID=151549 RepID=A0A4C1XJ02_EUMVA|nr:hypothetical protein EVAR_44025_1 [Eumeta japonica]